MMQRREAALQRSLTAAAETDMLSGLMNRRAFNPALDHLLRLSERESLALSVAIIDIDHFKQVNDTLGHLDGDAVIRRVARRLADTTHQSDLVARLGGDEFAVALPGAGPLDAVEISERFASALACDPTEPLLSVSIGIAGRGDRPSSIDELFARADDALYAAKRAGRACIRCWTASPQTSTTSRETEANTPANWLDVADAEHDTRPQTVG